MASLWAGRHLPVCVHGCHSLQGEGKPYVVLGIGMDGCKIFWVSGSVNNESSKFWLSVLNDLNSRGVKDVCVFCVDGLNGFREAIGAVYPRAQIQRCIIHQIRSSTRFVSYKDIKRLMADLKLVYQAVTEEEAREALTPFKETWGKAYPSCVKSWEENWDILSTFFCISARCTANHMYYQYY